MSSPSPSHHRHHRGHIGSRVFSRSAEAWFEGRVAQLMEFNIGDHTALKLAEADTRREALEEEVQAMHEAGQPVFRGGQRPGLPIERVAGAVQELGTHAVDVPLALARLRTTCGQDSKPVRPDINARREGLYVICMALKRITDSKLVQGVSRYKAKRIFEMIQLACCGGVADLYMEPSDVHALHAVYPLPDNSANALQLIFPSAKDELSQRHGLRLLEKKAFKRSDIYCLVAQLCFWTEQMKGKIQYMEESS